MNFYPNHWYQQPSFLGQAPPSGPPPGMIAPGALAVRPSFGVGGCGVPYGQNLGPYGLSYGLAADVAPPDAAAPSAFAEALSKLPSYWPWIGISVGGVLALTGIVLMSSK